MCNISTGTTTWNSNAIGYSYGYHLPKEKQMKREVNIELKFADDKVCDKDFYKKVVKLQQMIKDLGWEINSIYANITNE